MSNPSGTSPIVFSKNVADVSGKGKQRQNEYAFKPLLSAVRDTVDETE